MINRNIRCECHFYVILFSRRSAIIWILVGWAVSLWLTAATERQTYPRHQCAIAQMVYYKTLTRWRRLRLCTNTHSHSHIQTANTQSLKVTVGDNLFQLKPINSNAMSHGSLTVWVSECVYGRSTCTAWKTIFFFVFVRLAKTTLRLNRVNVCCVICDDNRRRQRRNNTLYEAKTEKRRKKRVERTTPNLEAINCSTKLLILFTISLATLPICFAAARALLHYWLWGRQCIRTSILLLLRVRSRSPPDTT